MIQLNSSSRSSLFFVSTISHISRRSHSSLSTSPTTVVPSYKHFLHRKLLTYNDSNYYSQRRYFPSAQRRCRVTMSTSSQQQADSEATESEPLVQYVVVRRDLLDEWPVGSVIAQAVHASVAAIWKSKTSANTLEYCNQSGNETPEEGSVASQMHTVVLEAKNEAAVVKLADKLEEAGVKFAVWKEQPENIVTALAAQPYKRSEVKKYFSKFRLFK